MPRSKLVGLLFEAWNDLDRVLEGLGRDDAIRNLDEGSSFAWTLAHTTNQVDAWINVRFQHTEPHELLGLRRFRVGGTGEAEEWDGILEAVQDVRSAARGFLEGMTDADLEPAIPYDGSLAYLRERGISLRYALVRAITHHYFHIGEISTKRDRLGHQVGNYPGTLEQSI